MPKDKRISRRTFLKILGGAVTATATAGVLWQTWKPMDAPESAQCAYLSQAGGWSDTAGWR